MHAGEAGREVAALLADPDFAAALDETDRAYLAACRIGSAPTQSPAASAKPRGLSDEALFNTLALGLIALIALGTAMLFDWTQAMIAVRRLADSSLSWQLAPERERALMPGETFRECASCPLMVTLPQSGAAPTGRLAVGRFEVTFDEWDGCVAHHGCPHSPGDEGWARGRRPVINVSWHDANGYAAWLSRQTGRTYRLLTEAEWAYAARAGAKTRYAFGDDATRLAAHAWLRANSSERTHPVGLKAANAFGLHDMSGSVWEWVSDCYDTAPAPVTSPASELASKPTGCTMRVMRGGSWNDKPASLTLDSRSGFRPTVRNYTVGFRIARELLPAAR